MVSETKRSSSSSLSQRTKNIVTISIFAALHTALDILRGPWRQWSVYLEPLEGMVLGPKIGFAAALIGSATRTAITGNPLAIFGMAAEPIGVVTAGCLIHGYWWPVVLIYGVMLGAYFAHPYGRILPLWTVLDIIIALILIYPTAKIGKGIFSNTENVKKLTVFVFLASFVSTVADSLVRVFLLVPVELYKLFFPDFNTLYGVFVFGAAGSYIEDILVTIVSLIISIPTLLTLKRGKIVRWPLS